MHKCKYTNTNTQVEKYTNKNTNSQIKRMVRPCSAVVAKLYKYIANSNYKYICNRFLRKQIQKNTGSYYANTAQMQLSNALLR